MSFDASALPYEMRGASDAARACLARAEHAAADDRGLLLTAEAGLDAEAVARAIHRMSARRAEPFVVVPVDVSGPAMERAVFGTHGRTGAAEIETVSAGSALARANGGILYVPALHDLPATLQRRLARVLRDGEVRLSRKATPAPLDVRLLAAVAGPDEGRVREDLLRRMPLHLRVPPLRERRADVPAIAEAMLRGHAGARRFTPAALTVLSALPWRRNTTELAGLVNRLVLAGGESLIRQEDVLAEVQLGQAPGRATGSLRDARRQFERDYIAAVLRDHEWQMRDAARALGIERANLYRKARQLGIPLRRDVESTARGLR
jgi:DNA-binding NtrC family response regulator